MTNKKDVEIKSKIIVDSSFLKSVSPHDHWHHAIVRVCERLEAAIDDQKKSYSDKVEVLMSVLECLLTDCLIRVSPQITSLLFDFILRNTLFLVFHNCWGENKIIKVHMESLFRRFRVRANKKKLKRVESEIDYLLETITEDPWSNTALLKILRDGNEYDGEVLKFVKSELGTFLYVRLEVLMYAKCDKLAMTLVENCLNCIHLPANTEYFKSFTNETTHLKYLYMLILNKTKHDKFISSRIASEMNTIELDQCIKLVNRCKNGELPFENLSKKAAIVVINTALASAVSRFDTNDTVLQDVIQLWFETMADNHILIRLLKHIVNIAVCSQYIYYMVAKLIERVKLTEKELCVEVFIKGLTLNVNEIERFKSVDDQTKAREHEIKMSNGFLLLAAYLSKEEMLYREIVLAAFSLNPTQSIFTRIEALGEKKDKVVLKKMDIENEQYLNKEGNTLFCGVACEETVMSDDEIDVCSVSPQPHIVKTFPEIELEGPYLCESMLTSKDSNVQVSNPNQIFGKTMQNDQIFINYKVNDTQISEKPRCSLSQIVSDLCLEDEDCFIGDRNRENGNKTSLSEGSLYLRVFDGKTVGIDQALCDDLASLVCCVKNHDLAWDMEWSEIIMNCSCMLKQGINKSPDKISLNMLKTEQTCSSHGETETNFSNTFNVKVKNPKKSLKRKRKHYSCR